jgi:hypothetical protein
VATDARQTPAQDPPSWLVALKPWSGLALLALIALVLISWGRIRSADERELLAVRRTQLAGYSPAAKNLLARNFERFERLPPEEQARRIALEAELSADPQQAELRETMQRYQQWLKTLSSSQRAELRSLPVDKRVARVAELRQAQDLEQARRQDQRAMAALVESRLLAQVADADLRDKLTSAPEFARRAVLFRQMGPQGMQELRRDLTPDELAAIEPELSESLRRQLHAAGADEARQRIVSQRLREVRRQLFEGDGLSLLAWMGPEPEPELDRFFKDDLTDLQRESLLSLPPDQMRYRLRRLYLHEKFPEVFPDRGSWWDTRGSRDRGRDGSRDRDRNRGGRGFPGDNRQRPGGDSERRGPSGRPRPEGSESADGPVTRGPMANDRRGSFRPPAGNAAPAATTVPAEKEPRPSDE